MSQKENTEPKWYVVHTYSGYENKVKTDLEKTKIGNLKTFSLILLFQWKSKLK